MHWSASAFGRIIGRGWGRTLRPTQAQIPVAARTQPRSRAGTDVVSLTRMAYPEITMQEQGIRKTDRLLVRSEK